MKCSTTYVKMLYFPDIQSLSIGDHEVLAMVRQLLKRPNNIWNTKYVGPTWPHSHPQNDGRSHVAIFKFNLHYNINLHGSCRSTTPDTLLFPNT